jgi:hypothetical protein
MYIARIRTEQVELPYMALVQKGPLFDCLTTVSVMLERSEASQGGVDFDLDTFFNSCHIYN